MTTLEEVCRNAPPERVLKIAKMVRDMYKQAIGNGEMPLEPARLRKINRDIDELEKDVYGTK